METTAPNPDTQAGIDLLGEKLGRIRSDIKDVVGLARSLASEKISGMTSKAIDQGKNAVSSVSDCIEDNPIRSALIAAGVGALVGFMVSRR